MHISCKYCIPEDSTESECIFVLFHGIKYDNKNKCTIIELNSYNICRLMSKEEYDKLFEKLKRKINKKQHKDVFELEDVWLAYNPNTLNESISNFIQKNKFKIQIANVKKDIQHIKDMREGNEAILIEPDPTNEAYCLMWKKYQDFLNRLDDPEYIPLY